MIALLLDYALGAIPLGILGAFAVAVFVGASLVLNPDVERDEHGGD